MVEGRAAVHIFVLRGQHLFILANMARIVKEDFKNLRVRVRFLDIFMLLHVYTLLLKYINLKNCNFGNTSVNRQRC